MKLCIFTASALALAASASAMIVEPLENREDRPGVPNCGEWGSAWVAVKPTETLKSGHCGPFKAACKAFGGVEDEKHTYIRCKKSKAHPGMVSVRCIKPAGEDFDQDFTPDALLKIKITENWKGDKLHELKGGDLCAKDYKFNV